MKKVMCLSQLKVTHNASCKKVPNVNRSVVCLQEKILQGTLCCILSPQVFVGVFLLEYINL